MANFAQLDNNNIVIQVIEVDESHCRDVFNVRSEKIAEYHLKQVYGVHTNWKETSIHGSIRGTYAGIGYKYHQDLDLFAEAQPYTSWFLSAETKRWESPIPKPSLTEEEDSQRKVYVWDEDLYQKDNTKGWVLKEYEYSIPVL